jgi:WD40 repeat protein
VRSIVSAISDETVRVWNASTGQQVHKLKGPHKYGAFGGVLK